MSVMSGLNRIDFVIPANSQYAPTERDAKIIFLTNMGITNWQLYHYSDTSPCGFWGYYATGVLLSTNGIATVATVTCAGAAHPPDGSNITPNPDPGVGTTYTWSVLGAPFSLRTTSGGGGGSIPQGNNNYYVWNISGNSSSAAADFTTAVNSIGAALASALVSGSVVKEYLKYVDSISGAWQVSAVFFGAGSASFGSSSTVSWLANNNIMYVVTCSGNPHPPLGSPAPPVTLPSFTQSFTTITAPLNFGPQR